MKNYAVDVAVLESGREFTVCFEAEDHQDPTSLVVPVVTAVGAPFWFEFTYPTIRTTKPYRFYWYHKWWHQLIFFMGGNTQLVYHKRESARENTSGGLHN